MIIDSKGKLFGKVSIIDIIVVLVVIAAVAGIGYKMTRSNTLPLTVKTDKIRLTFYGEEAPEYAVKASKVGDIVKDFDQGATFGRLAEEIKTGDALSFTDFTEYVDGQWIVGSKPGYCSYKMVVDGEAVINPDGGINIGGVNYYVGRSATIRVGNNVFTGRIYSIEKKE
ncbi:DUF4330 domain-containing protein [Acetivibrio clariflavus]|uniref:DUF4330 domain-containing protein n=1 Tax=Acetivibrio clariflavus (strain DSM 19732 / NBRC 101661 / EBR45) TaxID=720554 RepID=G8M2Q7_ACECE|nr:DUF4330 domain-containing protein [Acetivibrio clariflavus]AEV67131.1 hypothetical protein Clocl_0402 [Acetivibrio clariflavus DSM 19732]HOQ01046.1 DUF4330 domain-containing protein [Acetivibrio clariflavus]HPU41373.1 DUF4330 domain-containing protein [Acetivibrio clariflavus]